MKVLISWSGRESKMVATALREWLPCVIQAADPWMSESDIAPGDRWSVELAEQLKDAHFGIICLTPKNLNAPWIHFEAGALSKIIDKSKVCPYIFDLEISDLQYPLAQFESVNSDKTGTKKLVDAINDELEGGLKLPETKLDIIFEKWWPDLEEKLKSITTSQESAAPKRSIEDMFEEILELLRPLSAKCSKVQSDKSSEISSDTLKLLARKILNQLKARDENVPITTDEVETRLKLLIENFNVPVNDAVRSVLNYFFKEYGMIERV